MVHVRRKFVDVFERDGSVIAKGAIERIARLYAVEKDVPYKFPDERVALRQAKAKSAFDELEDWLKLQLPKISGKTKLAEAIRYALRVSDLLCMTDPVHAPPKGSMNDHLKRKPGRTAEGHGAP